eukprot:TRINITY_DN3955_c0_g1_i2.p1 TRINITY_DN3955_c0_g1~~TRINITY_DN3955_c0_g1_i2.p1  ORF type:complete len:462 (+),score=94.20 TRINITY_DN3955_c0_g1_i2:227-1612(+)
MIWFTRTSKLYVNLFLIRSINMPERRGDAAMYFHFMNVTIFLKLEAFLTQKKREEKQRLVFTQLLRNNLAGKNEKLGKTNRDIDEYNAESKHLIEYSNEADLEKLDILNKLEALRIVVKGQQEEKNTLVETLEILRRERDNYLSQSRSYDQLISTLQHQSEQLEQRIPEIEEQISVKIKEYEVAASKFEGQKEEHDSLIAKLTQQVEDQMNLLRVNQEEHQERMKETQEMVDNYERAVKVLQSELREYEQLIHQRERETAKAIQQFEVLEAESTDLRKQLRSESEVVKSMGKYNERHLQTLTKEIDELNSEAEVLRQQQSKLELERNHLAKIIQKFEAQAEALFGGFPRSTDRKGNTRPNSITDTQSLSVSKDRSDPRRSENETSAIRNQSKNIDRLSYSRRTETDKRAESISSRGSVNPRPPIFIEESQNDFIATRTKKEQLLESIHDRSTLLLKKYGKQ